MQEFISAFVCVIFSNCDNYWQVQIRLNQANHPLQISLEEVLNWKGSLTTIVCLKMSMWGKANTTQDVKCSTFIVVIMRHLLYQLNIEHCNTEGSQIQTLNKVNWLNFV